MARNYDEIDLWWGMQGDYDVGDDGDIKDTSEDQLLWLRQQVTNIVRSVTGDWEFALQLGANLEDFIGEPNSRETAERMRKQLLGAIIRVTGIAANDIAIKIVPINYESLMILIAISALPTQDNSLKDEWMRLSFVYNFGRNDMELQEVMDNAYI